MRKLLSALFFFLPTLMLAQGIDFVQNLSWKQILEKARAENKYIFVDCYTTWCGPCKAMEKNVYPLKEVGDAFNGRFISVKVQMDQTKDDDESVKAWYNDAKAIEKALMINAYPTLLFFSPDGSPVHRSIGYKPAAKLIRVSEDATHPETQYYTVLKNFQPGKADTTNMKELARSIASADNVLAGKIAYDYLSRIPSNSLADGDNIRLISEFSNNPQMAEIAARIIKGWKWADYADEAKLSFVLSMKEYPAVQSIVRNYVEQLPDKELYLPYNTNLAINFAHTPNDKGFKFCYDHPTEADKIMNKKGISQQLTDKLINAAEVEPAIQGTDSI
ncbi:MAG: DUF255 domain-containing protein, partial [Bacteroidetes bacterium]|nr:DUF255 domain-containing protein [Bacteroidota bacterium]